VESKMDATTNKCPVCGAAELIHDSRTVHYTYKGETVEIPDVVGDFCPNCSEGILEKASADRYSAAVRAFIKEINASAVDPNYILRVRTMLKLDQAEAGEIFGGGVNAFSRYETGKTRPSRSLVKLLKLLEQHPELLDEVRAA